MSNIDTILRQVAAFSGVPAKFAGVNRTVIISIYLQPLGFQYDLASMADYLLQRLQANEWNIQSIQKFDQDGFAGLVVSALVDNEYTLNNVKQSMTDMVVNQLNWSLSQDVVVQGPEGGVITTTPAPTGTVTPTPKPIQIITQAPGTGINTATTPKTTDTKSWFDKTFFTGAGTLTGAAVGILVVVAVVAVTSSQRK